VRKKLLAATHDPKERIIYIDAIQQLGVAYHFEEEIEAILQQFYDKYSESHCVYKDDLPYVALRFRILRQHGFFVSSGKMLLVEFIYILRGFLDVDNRTLIRGTG